jgi:hypothetical protein
MDSFLKKGVKSAPSGGAGHLAMVSAAERAKQNMAGEFSEDGGRLFCRVCNLQNLPKCTCSLSLQVLMQKDHSVLEPQC